MIAEQNGRYLDMLNTRLVGTVKLQLLNGGDLPPTAECAPINLLPFALFSSIDCYFNSTMITHSGPVSIAFRNYLEIMLSYTEEFRRDILRSGLYFKDEMGKYDASANSGYKTRKALFEKSNLVDFDIPIALDVFRSGKLIPNGVQIDLKFNRTNDEFLIMGNKNDPATYSIALTDLKIMARFVHVNDSILSQHKSLHVTQPIYLNFIETRAKVFNVPVGSKSAELNNAFVNRLPKTIILAFLDTDRLNQYGKDSYQLNPFNFKHYDLTHVAMRKNGMVLSNDHIFDIDLQRKNYERLYSSLHKTTGFTDSMLSHGISYELFCENCFLVSFSLHHGLENFKQVCPVEYGELAFSLKWGKPLPSNLSVLAFASYNAYVSIALDRTIDHQIF